MKHYVCENCGLAGPMSYFQGECRPGWTHGRLILITTDEQMQRTLEALDRIVVACDNGAQPEDKVTFIRRVADEARALPSREQEAHRG